MNKIFKVIWNQLLGAWVAVSELEKGNINVKSDGKDTLEVQLAKDIDLGHDGSVRVVMSLYGENAVALGYTKASDNGKVLLKLSGSTNTRGDVVSAVGLGYEW